MKKTGHQMSEHYRWSATNSIHFPYTHMSVTWMGRTVTRKLYYQAFRLEALQLIAAEMVNEIKAFYGIYVKGLTCPNSYSLSLETLPRTLNSDSLQAVRQSPTSR